MILKVQKTNGFFTVNGKRINEMNSIERKFLEDFFQEMKAKESQFLNCKSL